MVPVSAAEVGDTTNRVILIGRHKPVGLPDDVEIVRQENISWPATAQECVSDLMRLIEQARREGVRILLQAVPGQLAAALYHLRGVARDGIIGVVISVPGPRLAGVVREYTVPAECAGTLADAVRHANGRATVAIAQEDQVGDGQARVTVTVDPVPEFRFSHIEWL